MAEGPVRPPKSVFLLLMECAYLTNKTHHGLKGHSWWEWGMKEVCIHKSTSTHMHPRCIPLIPDIAHLHNPRMRVPWKTRSNKWKTIHLQAFLYLSMRVLHWGTSLCLLFLLFLNIILFSAGEALVRKSIPSFVTKSGLLDKLEWFTCIVILANFFSLPLQPQQSICISIAFLSASILPDIMSVVYEFELNVCICCYTPKQSS